MILATLANPTSGDEMRVEVQVDTGFSGWIAIDGDVIRRLGLQRIGEIRVDTATERGVLTELYAIALSIPELNITREVFASLRTTRSLVGRQILDNARWLLDNVGGRFCLLQ